MMHILISTDYSEVSNNAVDYGFYLAEKLGARVTLLHVFRAPRKTGSFLSIKDILRKDAEEGMAELMKELQVSHPNIECDSTILSGYASEEIVRASRDLNIDLIVMGTKGEHNLDEQVLGTTATRVLDKSESAIMVVPEDVKYQPLEQIANAIEPKLSNLETYMWLLHFAKDTNAKIHNVFVNTKNVDVTDFGENFPTLDDVDSAQVVLNEKSVLDALNGYIKKENIDVLASFRPKRSFFQNLLGSSHTLKFIADANVPILILK